MPANSRSNIKLHVVFPVFVLVLILSFGLLFFVRQQQLEHIRVQSLSNAERFQGGFQEHLEFDAEMLGGMLEFLGRDRDLQQAFLKENREELYGLSYPILENLHSRHQITHLYFIDMDSVCFLRVHEPSRHNDKIERFTLKQALETGKPSFGVELGPLGTFTLRYVYPWRVGGKLIGYLELGEEIGHISNHLSRLMDTGLVFTIDKSHLDRENWSAGLAAIGKTGNWDRFPSVVVAGQSSEELTDNLEEVIQSLSDDTVSYEIENRNHFFGVGKSPLLDAGNQRVGNVYIFSNVTPEHRLLSTLLKGIPALIILLGGTLFFLYNKYVSGLETSLKSLYEKLSDEIEERKKIADKLHQISMQYQLILNSAGEGIFGLDLQGNTTFINLSGAKMLGYRVEELIGQHMHSLVHHKKLDQTPYPWEKCRVCRTLRAGTIHAASEEYFWRKNDTSVPIDYLVHPIVEEGKTKGAVVVFRDISERKEREATLELAREQLTQSEKLAGIGRLAAGVAHEVLNPLNIISIHVQMMLQKTVNEIDLQKPMVTMKNEIKRIEKIVGTLLSFSRKGEAIPKSVSMNQLLGEVVSLMEKEMTLNNIEIHEEFDLNLPVLNLDPDEIRQVFFNLIQNARDAMQEKGILTIRTQTLNKDSRQHVRIQVCDTGCGISEENLTKIFEPFFTTKQEMYGTGMGLAVSRTLVEKQGGTIQVASELGKGTTFTLDFPIHI